MSAVAAPLPVEVPHDLEPSRLAAVQRYRILDTPPDHVFDRITALVATVLDVPIALVSIVDRDRIWFKSRHGLDLAQVERHPGLCASAILGSDLYIVPDTAIDPVACTNQMVSGELGLRFYGAAPLVTSDGHNLGTLSVLDTRPRVLSGVEMEILKGFGELIVREIELRIEVHEEEEEHAVAQGGALSGKHHAESILLELQRALVPSLLPCVAGAELAVRYRPAQGYLIGGDFYDVFELPDEGWAVNIGDVCGKDSRAAGVAAAARYALRAAALAGSSPAEGLALLNATLMLDADEEDARFCTAIHARLQPRMGGFRLGVASAGHPLPLVLYRDGSVSSVGTTGMIAGCFDDAEFGSKAVDLVAGDAVVFFTDGLTEARRGDEILGATAVEELLGSCAGSSAAVIADCLERAALAGGAQRDDIAILVLVVEG